MIQATFWYRLTSVLVLGTVLSVPKVPTVLAQASPVPSLPPQNRVSPPTDRSLPQPQGQVAPGDQVPNAQTEMKRPDLDDVKNYPDQVLTWVCNSQQNQTVAVQTKELPLWQTIMANNKDWQCSQNLPTIPANQPSFSCEPTDTMGLITVYWLRGKGGQTQMKAWMQALANQHNLVCTNTTTNRYWE